MDSKPMVTFHGDQKLFSRLQPILSRKLPSVTTVWPRPYRRNKTRLNLCADFVPFNEDILVDRDEWVLIGRPFLHIYWTQCNEITYKNNVKSEIQEWLDILHSKDCRDYLIVFVEHSEEVKFKTKLFGKSVYEKIKRDFNIGERSVQLMDPLIPQFESISNFDVLLSKLRHYLLESYSSVIGAFEVHMWEQRDLRVKVSDWSFNDYFILQEELAFMYEMLGLKADSIIQYDELDALFSQFLANYIAGGHQSNWITHMLNLPIRHWDGVNLTSVIDTDKREAIRRGNADILQFHNYLFSRQCSLLLAEDRHSEVSSRAVSFLHSTLHELHSLKVSMPIGADCCWLYLSAMEVLEYTRSKQKLKFTPSSSRLLDLARKKFVIMGELCGHYTTSSRRYYGNNDNNNNVVGVNAAYPECKVSSPPLRIRQTTARRIISLINIDKNLETLEQIDCLKSSLSSLVNFRKYYVELSELTIGAYKHMHRLRFSRIIGQELADLYMELQQPELAEPLYLDLLKCYNPGFGEGWSLLKFDCLVKLASCQRELSNNRYTQTCLDLCCIESGDTGIRLFHLGVLLRRISCTPPPSPLHRSLSPPPMHTSPHPLSFTSPSCDSSLIHATTTSNALTTDVPLSSNESETAALSKPPTPPALPTSTLPRVFSDPLINPTVAISLSDTQEHCDVTDADRLQGSPSELPADGSTRANDIRSDHSVNRTPSLYSTTSSTSSAVSFEVGCCDALPPTAASSTLSASSSTSTLPASLAHQRRQRSLLNATDSFTARLSSKRQRLVLGVPSCSPRSRRGSAISCGNHESTRSLDSTSRTATRNGSPVNSGEGSTNVIRIPSNCGDNIGGVGIGGVGGGGVGGGGVGGGAGGDCDSGEMYNSGESLEQLVNVDVFSKLPDQVTMRRLRISLIELQEHKRQLLRNRVDSNNVEVPISRLGYSRCLYARDVCIRPGINTVQMHHKKLEVSKLYTLAQMSFLLKSSQANVASLHSSTNLAPSLCLPPPTLPKHPTSPGVYEPQSSSPSCIESQQIPKSTPYSICSSTRSSCAIDSSFAGGQQTACVSPVVPVKPDFLKLAGNTSQTDATVNPTTPATPMTPDTPTAPASPVTTSNPAPEFLSDLDFNPNCFSVELMQEIKLHFDQDKRWQGVAYPVNIVGVHQQPGGGATSIHCDLLTYSPPRRSELNDNNWTTDVSAVLSPSFADETCSLNVFNRGVSTKQCFIFLSPFSISHRTISVSSKWFISITLLVIGDGTFIMGNSNLSLYQKTVDCSINKLNGDSDQHKVLRLDQSIVYLFETPSLSNKSTELSPTSEPLPHNAKFNVYISQFNNEHSSETTPNPCTYEFLV